MQTIAVISDIHGNILALEQIAADLKLRNVDRVFNLGDHVSGPLWPKETLQFLMQHDWTHIAGNHERQLTTLPPHQLGPSDRYAAQQLDAAELAWLASLPAAQKVGDEFLLVHGTPASDTVYFLETVAHGRTSLAAPAEINSRLADVQSPIILCGHSHIPRVVQTGQNILILNPGSVGLQAYDDPSPEAHIVENGSPHARYALLEFRAGSWIPQLIAVPYDHPRAARQAARNGRPDWEIALQTGYMRR